MSSFVPSAVGQLVWCPLDPSLGVGVVTAFDGPRVHIKFWRLQEERAYTTRGAENVIVRYEIGANDKVKDRQGRELRIKRRIQPETAATNSLYEYEAEDGTQIYESELVPNVRDIGAKERLASLNLVHPEVVRARLRGLRLGAVGSRPGHAAVLGGRVQWLPHQIDVATRALERDPVRLLLADEVGLGKTVEAALIYAGLRKEGRADRVLILTPDALTIQWLGEIFRKVHELVVLLDEERLDDAAQDFPELTPFEAYRRVVTSIDRLAANPVLAEQALQTEWDLVIVDEAHHLRWQPEGRSNATYRLVEGLARKTRHLLLLTATPMALDPTEYHALLRLLDPARFDDPREFKRIAERVATICQVARDISRAVSDKQPIADATRQSAEDVLSDDAEDQAELHRLIELKPGAKLRDKRAAVVLGALRDRHGLADFVVRNRRGPVGGLPERRPQVFALQPTPKQELLLDVGESVMLELAHTLENPDERRRRLGELLRALWATPRALVDILRPMSPELAQQLAPHIAEVVHAPNDSRGLPTGDARLRWLVETIRSQQRDEKILVFVESAIAVRALRDALVQALGEDVAMFHRALPPRDQDRQVAWFRDREGPQVMLSTEAGGEGRNFQFCHTVVLYDLPWRPATIEQRIGRVDRVGQLHDVAVLVPYFQGGYEAAILKVMQESIGVLDRTVGGIDHALEYVSDRLADLILSVADAPEWRALYKDTEQLVGSARQRIDSEVDTILDHASFSPERAKAVLDAVPQDLEAQVEAFVQRYASYSKINLHSKRGSLVAVEGAAGAAGDSSSDGYVATFSRTFALDHEDAEFLSFGHPLVQQAFEWAFEAGEASAALAVAKGFGADGAAFLWSYGVELPDDFPEARAYFDSPVYTFALDESGRRMPELDDLLHGLARPLDRMDAAPLRGNIERWRRLVDKNHQAAEVLAQEASHMAVRLAMKRLEEAMAQRLRDLRRAHARELSRARLRSENIAEISARHAAETAALNAERERLATTIGHATPRLLAAVAVRLMRTKQVSG